MERRATVASATGLFPIEPRDARAELTHVASTTTAKKDGTTGEGTKQHEDGLQNAANLLRDCRRLGAPGEVEAAKASTGRRHGGT